MIISQIADYFIPLGKRALVEKLIMSIDSSNLD